LNNSPSQSLEVLVGALDSLNMCAYGPVGYLQVKHGFLGFLGQEHETSIVFEKSQTIRVIGKRDIRFLWTV